MIRLALKDRLLFHILILGPILWGCTSPTPRTVAGEDSKPEPPKGYYFFSPQDRIQAIQKAKLFSDDHTVTDFMVTDPSKADFTRGPRPRQNDWFEPEQEVTCTFLKSGKEMLGNTPKFECGLPVKKQKRLSNGTVQIVDDVEPVKIKFGQDNGEVQAEILSTRLFWALGFFADRVYPVRVTCLECPEHPDLELKSKGKLATRQIPNTVIERKFGFKEMTEFGKPKQGWTWKELELYNTTSIAQKDALRLLAAFVKHGDNKAEQQRLLCPKDKVEVDASGGRITCTESYMMVQDLGATFGGAGSTTNPKTAKVNLAKWRKSRVWANPKKCEADLKKSMSATDGLNNPVISENGRRFLVERIKRLSTQQTLDLFKTARFSDSEAREWNDVFWKKVKDLEFPLGEQHANFHCPLFYDSDYDANDRLGRIIQ